MADARTYPHGVPSWIETEQPDPAAARDFYGELFGWEFEDRPGGYTIARLAGREAAGILPGTGGTTGSWTTYLAVDNADAAVARVREAGGRVLADPEDAGPAGRAALCVDPQGARFGVWQAGRRLGVQALNEPGAWNFSNLHTAGPATFYTEVFGWVVDDIGFGRMIRVPGYGDHLAATVDPTIHDRQAAIAAPEGFADAVGWVVPATGTHWHVVFTVADRDSSAKTVERRGGTITGSEDSEWSRTAVARDPWGAEFTLSQFTPPE